MSDLVHDVKGRKDRYNDKATRIKETCCMRFTTVRTRTRTRTRTKEKKTRMEE